jgi:hypothetical protein
MFFEEWVHINAHWRIKGVFNNLVKFVYKLGKNWQTRTWGPVFKSAGSAPDAAMILRLFSQKNMKTNIDRKLYWIVHFYLDFFDVFCLFCFLGFARRMFYPALFTLLYFIILVVAISF